MRRGKFEWLVGRGGEGRVRRLAVAGWCGGVESLNGAGPAGWLRKAAAGFRSPRPSAGWFGEERVGWREYGASRSRACSEGLQAHSVRRESCNSDSSPEPAAA